MGAEYLKVPPVSNAFRTEIEKLNLATRESSNIFFECFSIIDNLLSSHDLQLLRTMRKIIRIRLRHEFPFVMFLYEILITLLLGETNCVLFGFETEMRGMHRVACGLPSHQEILPSVSFAHHIPVHTPFVTVVVA